jgi:nitroimidazol reductase NimA-like FMN-containing flavoprotein (pyridoxamine 5'-phosphate oxidase superfamily)
MYLPNYKPPEKVGKLTEDELGVFLAQPWKARLATVTPENTPYIVPLWYEYDVGQRAFYIIARERSKYVQHIVHNPAVALHIADDAHLENTRVLVEGKAEILVGPVAPEDSREIREKAVAMAHRYMGEEGAEYAQRTMGRPRYLIKIIPRAWHSWSGREWAPHYRKE